MGVMGFLQSFPRFDDFDCVSYTRNPESRNLEPLNLDPKPRNSTLHPKP